MRFGTITSYGHGFKTGDLVRITHVVGMTDCVCVVGSVKPTTYEVWPDTWFWKIWGAIRHQWIEMRKVRY